MLKINGRKASTYIADRVEFDSHGSLKARLMDYVPSTGYLPREHRATLRNDAGQAHVAGENLYVVFSYDTPIAWYNPLTNRWTRPKVSYSMTTSHHQGRCPADGAEGV